MEQYIEIKCARENNLKNLSLKIPKNKLVVLTGISGSDKSTLLFDILGKAAGQRYYGAGEMPGKYDRILGWENIDKVGSYTGAYLRKLAGFRNVC